jgi:hypothetical protein
MAELWSLLSLLIAWVLGLISGVLLEPLKHWILGPKLEVKFIEDDKGFITDTKDYGDRDAHYVRVRVLNTGRQIARQCCAYLVKVEKWNESNGEFEPTIYRDSLQLAWSAKANTDENYRALDLPKDVPQFIDIVSTRKPEIDYEIKTKPHLYRYESLFKEHGKFQYTVLVSGDNAKPKSTKIIFEWSGDWDNFEVTAG